MIEIDLNDDLFLYKAEINDPHGEELIDRVNAVCWIRTDVPGLGGKGKKRYKVRQDKTLEKLEERLVELGGY